MTGKKVFLVEDDLELAEAFVEALSLEGFIVETTNRAEMVVSTALAYQPDIILMDGILNHQNTVSICQQLKNLHDTQEIPVILVSGHHEAKTWMQEAQADALLPKPLSIPELVITIEHWIG
ncbi:MAG: response regulator [Anaerolineae bacterium]|nr:response regulator [Anaerolineae bacterium]